MKITKADINFVVLSVNRLGFCFILFCTLSLHPWQLNCFFTRRKHHKFFGWKFSNLKILFSFLSYTETHVVQKLLEVPSLFVFKFISSGTMWQSIDNLWLDFTQLDIPTSTGNRANEKIRIFIITIPADSLLAISFIIITKVQSSKLRKVHLATWKS